MAHRLVELLGQVCAGDGFADELRPVGAGFNLQIAQHHIRVLLEIAVDEKALRRLLSVDPVRHNVD